MLFFNLVSTQKIASEQAFIIKVGYYIIKDPSVDKSTFVLHLSEPVHFFRNLLRPL